MLNPIIKKLFCVYIERLYKLELPNLHIVEPRKKVSFMQIRDDNYDMVRSVRSGNFYIHDFKKMLSLGDYGLFICVDNIPVGYGWAKMENSKDYFFYVKDCYLCRFFIEPEYRGNNLYPAIIIKLIQDIQKWGINTFFIAAEYTNIPSLRGIEKVGFVYQDTFYFLRVLKMTLNKHLLGK